MYERMLLGNAEKSETRVLEFAFLPLPRRIIPMQSLPEDGDLASIHQPPSHSSNFPYFLAWTTLPLFLLSPIVLYLRLSYSYSRLSFKER